MTTLPTPAVAATRVPPPNPFVGPQSIGVDMRIHGRTREIRELRDRVIADRIVLMYSPSGAGKTSLLNAGLRPELERRGFTMLPAPVEDRSGRRTGGAIRVNRHPTGAAGNRYVDSVKQSLEDGRDADARLPLEQLANMTLADYLAEVAATVPGEGSCCLVFDQFEELITLDPTDAEAKAEFMVDLGDALRRNRRLWAIFAMREDYLAPFDDYHRSIPTHLRSRFRLDLLTAEQAKTVVRDAARSVNVEFDSEAAQSLVDNLRRVQIPGAGTCERVTGPHVEPVQLQVVCSRLWSQLGDGVDAITKSEVDQLGNVDDALGEFYATEVRAVADATGVPEREIRDWIETALISRDGIRMQAQAFEARASAGEAVLDGLVDAHLLRADYRNDKRWFELAHDRLVDPVRRSNARWRLVALEPVQRRSVVWAESGRPSELLLRGADLREAKRWRSSHQDEITEIEDEYLGASEKQRSRKVLVWVLGLLGLLVVAGVAAVALLLRPPDRTRRRQSTGRRRIDRRRPGGEVGQRLLPRPRNGACARSRRHRGRTDGAPPRRACERPRRLP